MISARRVFVPVAIVSLLVPMSVARGAAQATESTRPQDTRPTPGDVRLFQSFFADARISGQPYWGGAASAQDYSGGNAVGLDAMAGFPFTPQVELQGRLGFVRTSPDGADGSSGLTDLFVTGQYLFDDLPLNDAGDAIDISVGGYADLPIGEEDIGGGTFDLGVFGALRYDLNDDLAFTGNVGLDFVEGQSTQGDTSADERNASISLGGGTIYRAADDLNLVGEFRLETEFDYAALSGGVDYVAPFGHVRGALLVGLDDGAPDVALAVQLLRSF